MKPTQEESGQITTALETVVCPGHEASEYMTTADHKKTPASWSDVKKQLADFDRAGLPESQRPALLERLDAVRHISHNFGYGVGDDMDVLLAKFDAKG